MKKLRHILVAIKEPRGRSQPALRKAAQLAEGSGATLTLFHALCTPLYMDAYNIAGQSLQQMQKEWRERALAQLEKLAAPLRAAGIKVAVASQWDFPAYEAVIRQAQRAGADLIVAERHATRHLLPSLLRFNDWELLRRSPVPVLLIKRRGTWHRPAVLAAIDPSHSFAKPARLDAAIMAAANLLAGSLGGKLHIAHAWANSPLAAATQLSPVAPEMTVTLQKKVRRDRAGRLQPRGRQGRPAQREAAFRRRASGGRDPEAGAPPAHRHRGHGRDLALWHSATGAGQCGRAGAGCPALRCAGGEAGELQGTRRQEESVACS